jgi:hypothetical protein
MALVPCTLEDPLPFLHVKTTADNPIARELWGFLPRENQAAF